MNSPDESKIVCSRCGEVLEIPGSVGRGGREDDLLSLMEDHSWVHHENEAPYAGTICSDAFKLALASDYVIRDQDFSVVLKKARARIQALLDLPEPVLYEALEKPAADEPGGGR